MNQIILRPLTKVKPTDFSLALGVIMELAKIFTFILLFQLIGCSQTNDKQRIFYGELGEEKEAALESLINSFHEFLKSNYPDKPTLGERTRAYLKEVLEMKRDWSYNQELYLDVLKQMEDSGLRRDIYIYNSELLDYPDYNLKSFISNREDLRNDSTIEVETDFEDIIEIDLSEEEIKQIEEREKEQKERWNKTPHYNFNGLFICSMAIALHKDSTFQQYFELKDLTLELSPSLLAQGMSTNMNNDQLESWENQLIIISEIYYFDLLWNFEIKNKLNDS